MITRQWKTERIASGKYRVRVDGNVIPGQIIGGNRRWQIQLNNVTVENGIATLRKAAGRLVARHFGL